MSQQIGTDAHTLLERWLREEVASAYDAIKGDPSRAKAAKDFFNALRSHHSDRKKKPA